MSARILSQIKEGKVPLEYIDMFKENQRENEHNAEFILMGIVNNTCNLCNPCSKCECTCHERAMEHWLKAAALKRSK
jgi:ferredoxin